MIGQSIPHESAHLHVTGRATYVDDIATPQGTLHAALGLSSKAHAHIDAIDFSAVLSAEGVVAAFTAKDIAGQNLYGAVLHDEPFLAEGTVQFMGQPIFVVIAQTMMQARIAARLATITYRDLPAVLTIEAAKAQQSYLCPPITIKRGDTQLALATSDQQAKGRCAIGGQEHFYLEGHVALAIPLEDGQMQVIVSTQHPTEMQQVVATILGIDQNDVLSQVRRMGGGFGGKEVQPAQFAAIAALAANHLQRPVKLRLDRDDDMIITGKRHDFTFDYTVGFSNDGMLKAFDLTLDSRCGFSADYSHQVNDRALCHVDNAYFHQNLSVLNHRCRTNTQSGTAFRGFGAPQGMFAIEHAMETIARQLQLDPLTVRKRNFYGDAPRNITHYGAKVEGFLVPEIVEQLEQSSDYWARREAIKKFNQDSPIIKRGLALTPVMFGVSFNASFLNRGSAMVALYLDGSIALNHAGTEMGQGLFTKIAQIVADAFGVGINKVRTFATDTSKLPNTSPTAASAGSDLNGMAALDACNTLKQRLFELMAAKWQCDVADLSLADGHLNQRNTPQAIDDKAAINQSISLAKLAQTANFARVHLVAHGFYNTPKIHWDGAAFYGQPFYYYAFGASVSEVAIDTLTGEHKLLRVDMLHDVGQSLNPAIDIGQIEGGFVQGLGYLTCEELVWDQQGALRTHAPSTYKIPTAGDIPEIFNVALLNRPNHEPTIYRSKAVGEPPLMLALSAWFAIADAVSSISNYTKVAPLIAPATPEAILNACDAIEPHD